VKRTLLLIRGDCTGSFGLIFAYWHWFRFEQRLRHGRRYVIRELIEPSVEMVLSAMADANAVMIYGHGSSDGRGAILQPGTGFQHTEVAKLGTALLDASVVSELEKLRQAPLDFVFSATCFGASNAALVSAWLRVTREYTSYPGTTFDLDPRKITFPVRFLAEDS
jgi:hypothetical protein